MAGPESYGRVSPSLSQRYRRWQDLHHQIHGLGTASRSPLLATGQRPVQAMPLLLEAVLRRALRNLARLRHTTELLRSPLITHESGGRPR